MKLKVILLVCLSLLVVTPVSAKGPFEDKATQIFDPSGTRIKQIGVTLYYNKKTKPEFLVKGTFVSIRSLFGATADQISWDPKSKVAFIEIDSKQLIITQNKNHIASENQVVWPSEWAVLQNGATMISIPYLAYIFDRYAGHHAGSAAALWKGRLLFLGISYIDRNDSSLKDNTLHAFINFE